MQTSRSRLSLNRPPTKAMPMGMPSQSPAGTVMMGYPATAAIEVQVKNPAPCLSPPPPGKGTISHAGGPAGAKRASSFWSSRALSIAPRATLMF